MGKRFESSLHHMMVVGAVGHLQMKRDSRVYADGPEKLLCHASVKSADPFIFQRGRKYEKRPPAYIQYG